MGDLREDLEASFESTESAEDELAEAQQEVLQDEPEETTEKTETEASDDTAATDSTKKSEAVDAEGEPSSAGDNPDAEAASDLSEAASKDSMKAPAGWKPSEREQWSKIPRPLQERITAREKEMADVMANTKQARSVNDYVSKMGETYGNLAKEAGFNHPLEAATAALGTMRTLSGGSTREKAQEVASLINQYGIDIETLDDALVNMPSPKGQQQRDPQSARLEQMMEERLRPFQEMMTNQQRQQQQAEQQRGQQATQAVQEFSQNAEFLNDVREDMADIIELAAKRGVDLTLQQAYDRACNAHPEIANVIMQRREQDQIKGNQSSLQSKRSAASSISGRKSGSGGSSGGSSLRDTLAQAYDEAQSG
jgi:hypothetical protein